MAKSKQIQHTETIMNQNAEQTQFNNSQSRFGTTRSLKNLVLKPEFQLKYSFFFVGLTLMVMGGVFLLFLFSLEDMIRTVAVIYRIESDVVTAIQASIHTATYTTLGIALIFAVLSVSLGVILTHRLVGPMIPIQRLIQQLNAGEYGATGKLRDRDDYKEIMDDLNRLSHTLAQKHGTKN